MIPILYRVDEQNYISNGIGRLTDCVTCIVTEERNGIYELEFEYPITGKHYEQMVKNGGIISCIHDDTKDLQLFDIYAHTDPIDGIVKFNANHISYRLANVILQPFTAYGIVNTFDSIRSNAITNCQFSFWTDKSTDGKYTVVHPVNVREILGGTEGSILDVFGSGDYEFDNFEVKLYANRGFDTGVTIRYGKNLAEIQNSVDTASSYSAIIPYWINTDGDVVVYGDIVVSPTLRATTVPWTNEALAEMQDGNGTTIEFRSPIINARAVDFSADFEEQPTEEQLEAKALQFIINNQTWKENQNIKVNFVQLWQTPEYEDVAALQRVSLCDLVSVYFPEMGITQSKQKVIRVVYNVLLERYDEIELGQAQTTLFDLFDNQANELVKQESSVLKSFVETQTRMVTGGLGGYVVLNPNASGEPQEILIMDSPDKETAVNVIRMNRNGIGFSRNGYAGPFRSAWTIDGKFNADFISAGTMLANHIKGGTLSLGGLNDSSGTIVMLGNDGQQYGYWNNAEIRVGLGGNDFVRLGTNGMRYELSESIVQNDRVQFPSMPDGTLRQYMAGSFEWESQIDNWWLYTQIIPAYIWLASQKSGSLYSKCRIQSDEIYLGGGTEYEKNIYLQARTGDIFGRGNLTINGTKSREVETQEYGNRLLYCYETPTPMFGDIGEGVIDETGFCYVFLDPIFAETITTMQYQVFLQKYGEGDCLVSERNAGYFVVKGEPGLSFGWELKAKQNGYDQLRLEKKESDVDMGEIDYGEEAANYYFKLQDGRIAA